MKINNVIRMALQTALEESDATAIERQQAESLLLALADLIESQTPPRRPRACELRKAVNDSSLDRLWRSIEDEHYAMLKPIFIGEIDTEARQSIARVCVGLVLSEINLRKAQRILDAIDG